MYSLTNHVLKPIMELHNFSHVQRDVSNGTRPIMGFSDRFERFKKIVVTQIFVDLAKKKLPFLTIL